MANETETVPDNFADFDATLSLTCPLADYHNIMNSKVKVDAFIPTEIMYEVWDKLTTAACQAVWHLLFDQPQPSANDLENAAALLKEHKGDACFYGPDHYNERIVDIRDELLRRQMFGFWKNVIVAQELGPAWARDSDLYDDMDDPEPANFYRFAGCEAPWIVAQAKKVEAEKFQSAPTRKEEGKGILTETSSFQ